jgi:MoxR-like ATPase
MLTDVPVINQKQLKAITKATIRSHGNILCFGPSGAGKTFICNEAVAEENCRLIYINLAVLERTDFQGFPVISDDKKIVSYATPEFLPFADCSTKNEITTLKTLINSIDDPTVVAWAQDRVNQLEALQKAKNIQQSYSWVKASAPDKIVKNFEKVLASANKVVGAETPIVIMFDEADKAMAETMQTLLELLQFHSINARALNIKANILTGNLPDEHAHTSQISHAITKRCKTFRLEIDFNQWREWAFKNNVNDQIIQYLSTEPGMIYKTVPDGDTTAYALPSPRTWTDAAYALSSLEDDSEVSKYSLDTLLDFKLRLIAGSVGDTAAVKFSNWYKYYRQFDPIITELVQHGKHPPVHKLTAQEMLIMAISACSRVYAELKPKNDDKIQSITKNVYSWIKTLPPDAQMGAVRLSFGGDWDNCHKYNLPSIPEFRDVFRDINDKLAQYDANLSQTQAKS